MGASTKTVGGSGEKGQAVSSDFITSLQALLGGQSGQMGAGNPAGGQAFGSTQGAADVFANILGPGAGEVGGAIAQLLQRSQDRDVNKIKEGYRASGGAQFGTPGAYAESMYRGEAAPNVTKAIGDLQMGAATNIMKLLAGVYDKETPQAQTQTTPGIFDRILQTVGAIAPAATTFLAPGLGGGALKGAAPSAATRSSVDQTIQGLTPIGVS